jgi:hypothetical protein
MGLILIPYLLINAVIGIIYLIKGIKMLMSNAISKEIIISGIASSLVLIGMIVLYLYFQKRVYAFKPIFMFPFYTIIIPFLLLFINKMIDNESLRNISTIAVFCIATSFIIISIALFARFDIIKFLGVEKYY